MAGPERIDPNAISWGGAAGIKQQKDTVDIGQGQASTRSSNASAANQEARNPYVAPQEAAQTKKLEVEAERLTKGVTLSETDQKAIDEIVGQYQRFEKLLRGFRDGYAGSVLDIIGRAENTIQSRFPKRGTPGQTAWWQDLNKGDLLERHTYFGASLTTGEKEAWAETTVTPGMAPEVVRANLAKRRNIAAKALSRRIGTYLSGDYRPEQIKEAVGPAIFEAFKPDSREATLAALEGAGKPEASDNPAGERVKAPRLSPEGEAVITSYARNADDFSPEGYTNLLLDMYEREGLLTPEQRASSYEATLPGVAQFFEGLTPEQRKNVGAGLNYDRADEQALKDAGPGEVIGSALANLPESAANLIQGVAALPVDTLASITEGERYGALKGVTDLAGELLSAAGGEPSGPAMQALGQMIEDRYGSVDGFKQAFATDPAGVAGDLSLVLTGGGSAAAKVPGVAGSIGRGVAAAGRAIDPLSAGVAALENAPRALNAVPQAVRNAPGAVAGTALGLTTGLPGGQGFRRAASVGFDRGLNGPSTRSANFLDQMRGGDPSSVVERVEEAVRRMQDEASRAYDSGMIDTRNDATVLDFTDIDNTLSALGNRAFYNGQIKNQRAADVFERVRSLVDEWKGLDPAQFHTPQGMDALKQRIGDIGDDFLQNNDRRAASIANGVYRSVRSSIARQVPSYDRTMRRYEEAQNVLRQIRTTFSVNPKASVDTQLRKLQSLLRNNANTNYGYRAELGRMIEDRGGVNLMDDLSAQSLSSITPRGLQGLIAGGTAAASAGASLAQMIQPLAEFGTVFHPANALALPLMSPRAMGEASYYGGVGAGLAARGARSAYSAARPALDRLANRYQSSPTAFLAAGRAGDVAGQLGDRPAELPGLADITSGELIQPEPTNTVSEDDVVVLAPGERYDDATDEVVAEDGSRRPAHPKAMAEGGAVRRTWGDASREAAKGATFAWNDELEAAARAAAKGDPTAYRREVNRIRARQAAAAGAAPFRSLGWEFAGAVAPSLVSRRPAASTSRLSSLAARYPNVARGLSAVRRPIPTSVMHALPEFALDAGMSALYATGEANTVDDIPRKLAEEMPEAMAMYGIMGGATSGLKRLYNRYIGRR